MKFNILKFSKKLFSLLTPNEFKNVKFLIFMMLIMAILDTVGVASILPFMAVLSNPKLIETNLILSYMFNFSQNFGIENNQQFLFALGVLVFVLLIISLIFKAFTTFLQFRFVQMREYSIGKRIIAGYLHQPYSWFLSRNSADIGKTILDEVERIVRGGFKSIMELISKSAIIFALLSLLFFVNFNLTLTVGITIGGTYVITFYFIRKFLNRIGKVRLEKNKLRFIAVSESFGAAKEIKVAGLEESYIKRFSSPAYVVALTQVYVQIVAQLPRYILEATAFGGVLITILYLMNQSGNFSSALPIISLYVYAGYRLIPAIQSIYASFTALTFISPSLDNLTQDIKSLKPFDDNQKKGVMPFNDEILLRNISFNYPNSSRAVLNNINLSIPEKSTVGLVGPSGSGKTTIVDIILGLLEANKGILQVDGETISKNNRRSWQKNIGYVPQHIFLADDTIAANIAFGINPENINQNSVEKASKIANLHNFVIDELPSKYQTVIGERGIRLSGGQRQRIGIARALYHNPKLLILDEATSALDNYTEEVVMEAVNNLRKNITIILIAHRLNTVKKCDIVFKIEKGQIVHKGDYEEIVKINT